MLSIHKPIALRLPVQLPDTLYSVRWNKHNVNVLNKRNVNVRYVKDERNVLLNVRYVRNKRNVNVRYVKKRNVNVRCVTLGVIGLYNLKYCLSSLYP